LVAKHVFVDEASSPTGPAVGFLDLATATLRKRVLWRRRTADLAALGASLPRRSVSAGLRLRFVAAYLAQCRARLPSMRPLARKRLQGRAPSRPGLSRERARAPFGRTRGRAGRAAPGSAEDPGASRPPSGSTPREGGGRSRIQGCRAPGPSGAPPPGRGERRPP